MANNADISYEPVDIGGQQGLRFTGPTGKSFTLYGQPAAELKAAVDKAKATGPQQLAGPAVPGDMGEQQPPPLEALEGGVRRDPTTGAVLQYQPGTAGVSQAQLERKAAQGVTLPVSQQRSVQGGFEPSEAAIAGMREVDARRVSTAEEATALARRAAESERTAAEAEMFAQGERLRVQQEKERRIASEVKAAEDRRLQAELEYKSGRVDPKRIFSGEGGELRQIGAAIASALGAFGAAMTGSGNFAQQIIQSSIDRDIEAQKEEIRVKGAAADNALNDLMSRRMTQGQAEAALRAQMLDYSAAVARWRQAQYGDENARIAGDALYADLLEAKTKQEEAYRQESLGIATETVTAQVAYPRAASPGGWRPVSPERAQKLTEGHQAIKAGPKGAAGNPANAEVALKVTQQLSEDASAARDASELLKELRGAVKPGQEPATFWGPSGSIPGSGVFGGDTAGFRAIQAKTDSLSRWRQQSDKVDQKQAANAVEGNGSVAERIRGAESVLNDASDRLVRTLAGMKPDEAQTMFRSLPTDVQAEVRKRAGGSQ